MCIAKYRKDEESVKALIQDIAPPTLRDVPIFTDVGRMFHRIANDNGSKRKK